MKIEMKILDARLNSDELTPRYATTGAAAIDLRAMAIIGPDSVPIALFDPIRIRPGEVVKIGTGIAMHLGNTKDVMFDYAALLLPRSGLGSKKIRLANAVGLVDADYQGEFILAIENGGNNDFVIRPKDRLAQAMIVPVMRPSFEIVNEFSSITERCTGGFGHTGVA